MLLIKCKMCKTPCQELYYKINKEKNYRVKGSEVEGIYCSERCMIIDIANKLGVTFA